MQIGMGHMMGHTSDILRLGTKKTSCFKFPRFEVNEMLNEKGWRTRQSNMAPTEPGWQGSPLKKGATDTKATPPYHTVPYHIIPFFLPFHTTPYHTIPYYTITWYLHTMLYQCKQCRHQDTEQSLQRRVGLEKQTEAGLTG